MEERFEQETKNLKYSWARHGHSMLSNYLVQGVEDPRLNAQSILSRHFLIKQLFGDEFDFYAEHELRFAVAANWLLGLLKNSTTAGQLQSLLDALIDKKDCADGIAVPPGVSEIFNGLAFPNYIVDTLSIGPLELMCEDVNKTPDIPEYIMKTFREIWKEILAEQDAASISVLEPACGSANDYRFIKSYGLSHFLDYNGMDICEENIDNANLMFGEVDFAVGNAIGIEHADSSFEYCFVHDLFEHLSLAAMEQAVSEICRVTKKSMCVHFFNMQDVEDHTEEPVDVYHWNTLSVSKIKCLFENHASSVEVIHIDSLLKDRFNYPDTHNKNAWTFIVTM